MILWFLCMLIGSIESYHSLNPWDFTCKKREYQLITDQTRYGFTLDNPLITIDVGIGSNDREISPLVTELWYEQIDQQSVILKGLFQADGELNRDQNHSWNFRFSSLSNRSGIPLFTSISQSSLNIQSTIFHKQLNLLLRTNDKDSCSYPNSSIDVGICCNLCSTSSTCSEMKILPEHSRYDIIVTNRGLMVPRTIEFFGGDLICSLFPSETINRFWSTITDAMNVDQVADKNDFAIVQYTNGIRQEFFHYSLYPFHQWIKQTLSFDFLDVLCIPHRHFAIFELNECQNISCKLFLRIFSYQLNKTLKLNDQLHIFESIIETNVSATAYFRLYFHMRSNILYLIGTANIYASTNYGQSLIRIWTDDVSSDDLLMLHPIVFSDTGHIAFIYRIANPSSCCQYFAVFSKAGLYYAWRTRTFRSSILMDQPFFFDSTGSFYFNTTPPLLVILAVERSLVATSNLLVNRITNLFFVRETDLNRFFVFCSLSSWDDSFELIGSTLRIDKLGLFFVINMDRSFSSFAFCLQTSRLDYQSLQTSRQCSLHIRIFPDKVHLSVSECVFTNEDEHSTISISNFPNIFLDQIFNETSALGRIFQETTLKEIQVKQWHLINIPKIEQVLDRCLVKNIDENHHRPSFISLRPTMLYPLAEGEQLVTKQFNFLIQNNYELMKNNFQLLASSFDKRKAIIAQEYLPSQLSCYLPVTRTITFITECLAKARIRPEFKIDSDLSKLIPMDPPINFQFNRYEAGFPSVIVYNLANDKPSICDGWKNCSCVSSLLSHHSIYCAEQFYRVDSTVNNRVYMTLSMEKEGKVYAPKNESIFLIEEISKRKDYELIENLWTREIQQRTVELFAKNLDQLTDNELRIFHLLSTEKPHLFLGPNLNLQFLDEGLYHFRLTYLWGDQFCLTSTDLLILMISNTATLPSYVFNYFLACIILFIFIVILWIIYELFHEKIFPRYARSYLRVKSERFFTPRLINDNINFEILVKIREQSHRLLPYKDLISKDLTTHSHRKDLLRQHIRQLVHPSLISPTYSD